MSPSHKTRDRRATAVADRLHSASIHLLRRLRRTDEATGVSPARLSALSVVVFGGPLSLGGLAAAEQVTPATMSRIVSGLVHDGLVRRQSDPSDLRAIRIRATAKGVRVLERGRKLRIAALAEPLGRLPREDVATLDRAAQLMERISR